VDFWLFASVLLLSKTSSNMVVMYESSFIQVMVVLVQEITVAGFAHKKESNVVLLQLFSWK
jgi:hypothetical protein